MQTMSVGDVAGVTWPIFKFWDPLYLRNNWNYTFQSLYAYRGL